MKPAQVAKFLTSLAGVAGIAITIGLATGTVAKWVTLGISAATAIAVYLVPNTPVPAADVLPAPEPKPSDTYPPV